MAGMTYKQALAKAFINAVWNPNVDRPSLIRTRENAVQFSVRRATEARFKLGRMVRGA